MASSRLLRLLKKKFFASGGSRSISCFWKVILLGFGVLSVYLLRVYLIATRDPGGKAAEIARECRQRRDENAGIPKVIHQIWLNDEEIPDRWKAPIKSCRDTNPGYEYRLWTLKDIEELIRSDYPWFMPTFAGYQFRMQKGDAARYVILHKYGGVYLDLDITCVVSLDTMLTLYDLKKTDALASDVPGPGLLDTPIIISKKANPFMEFCMRKLTVMNNNYILPFLTVYFSTGPYFLSLSYLQYPCWDTVHRIDTMYTRSLHFLHQQSASWQIWDALLIKFFERIFIPLFILILIAKVLISHKTQIMYIIMKPKIYNNNNSKENFWFTKHY